MRRCPQPGPNYDDYITQYDVPGGRMDEEGCMGRDKGWGSGRGKQLTRHSLRVPIYIVAHARPVVVTPRA